MAVNSEVRTSLRMSMIFASPFIVPPGGENLSQGLGGGFRSRVRVCACTSGIRARYGRGRFGEEKLQNGMAGTALVPDPAAAQLVDGGGAPGDFLADSALGDAAADADDHRSGFYPDETMSQ